jgi:hypothetical protein
MSERAALKAAADFEKEQKRREGQRRREEAVRQRDQAMTKAQAALDKAEREHGKRVAAIQAEVEALEKRTRVEETRWEKERERLQAALRRARDKAGKTELTIAIPGAKKSRRGLETFSGLPNFFGVAIAAAETPSGSRDLSRAPDGVRSLLVPILLLGGLGYEV